MFPVVGGCCGLVEQKVEDAQGRDHWGRPGQHPHRGIGLGSTAYERKRNALSGDGPTPRPTTRSSRPAAVETALRRLANVVSSTEDQWEAFQTARPASGLDAMQRANLALEKLARTPRPGNADFASFVDAVEVFAAAAARVGESVKQLSALQDRGGR